ncbi:protein of unknown function (plasmid) [Cupriavidus taiwanensis]|uniref:Uncharacterized protein n=1 Tax=Cupriavidus taiwanensis TaxID=164546 RepID=A0A375HFI4_9BURK|nr:protein of unknown function [Cupriavidus taiwanensis]SOZ72245.1 protein of unknown function [Cupriavidus taiwanensis]SOZ74552.1 protein of unknown function [Cupriavidus taiwanensis]SPA03477.1 protein of unknown function [Cupriavidus taiwanensis]SPA57284.1 protein of unknown function [Cupriavidus taiwanensis]
MMSQKARQEFPQIDPTSLIKLALTTARLSLLLTSLKVPGHLYVRLRRPTNFYPLVFAQPNPVCALRFRRP